MKVQEVISLATLAAGSAVALAAHSAILPKAMIVLAIIGTTGEWWKARKTSPETADRLPLWVGLALMASWS
jgi:hypothetical protein